MRAATPLAGTPIGANLRGERFSATGRPEAKGDCISNQDFNTDSGGSYSSTDGIGSDTFTETTSKSWLEKIVDGFKAILFGLIFVIAAGALMFWNEGRSAKTAAALTEGAGAVLSVAAGKVDPANEGKLVHVAGDTSAAQAIREPDLGFEARGLKLARKVEMYQWKEEKRSETRKKLGGGEETVTTYSYTKEWSDRAVDSSRFRNSADHRNPSMPGVGSRSFQAPDARLGAFVLGERVGGLLPTSDTFDVPDVAAGQARARFGQRARVQQGVIYAGADPDQPQVGDVRVTYRLLPITPVSVVARQTQSTFAPWTASNGNEVLLAETGVQPAALLFKHGQDENRVLTWILRGVGVLIMFIGFRMALSLFEALADVIPLLGDIVGAGASAVALLCTMVVAPIVIAIAWFFYRPLVAAGVLAAGFAIVWGLRTLMKSRAAARAPNPMAPAGPAPGAPPASFLGGASIARRLPGGPGRS